ncbi:MAG: dTMP kinase [Caldilineaceae bacterium SB0675_bin_29]|uniref:Thymidylate kinase n=1 Tax=Caldilineaceae bacterium SB0675_bin_29 TaxID=2605266 RepID=A0A6B1FWZ4_9CHLR|nr:dTMP kinase [Caldilineaceae bacterium SB0675_bin_29]
MFITFEGSDGSGKTTQIHLLADHLKAAGRTVLTTREPGGTRIGDGIRQLLLDLAHTEMHARAETLLFNAARAQIVAEVIRPALAACQIVLCDRFDLSTFAYQGYGHLQDIAQLERLIAYATGGLRPDLTLYLDLPPEDGIRRNRGRADGDWNRLDAQELSFYQRVESGYRRLIAQQPQRWTVIDANRPRDEVHQDIIRAVQHKLPALARSRSK